MISKINQIFLKLLLVDKTRTLSHLSSFKQNGSNWSLPFEVSRKPMILLLTQLMDSWIIQIAALYPFRYSNNAPSPSSSSAMIYRYLIFLNLIWNSMSNKGWWTIFRRCNLDKPGLASVWSGNAPIAKVGERWGTGQSFEVAPQNTYAQIPVELQIKVHRSLKYQK
jgi:hypothetical protein